MTDREAPMRLRLVTPQGVVAEVGCDSVQLMLTDDETGKNGGLVGIWRGHAPALMALGRGAIVARRDEVIVLRAEAEGGFASVRDDIVTVITDSASVAK